MARAKKHSECWTICYAVQDSSEEDGFWTGTWFAYGKTAEEAKEKFMEERRNLHEFCGELPAELYTVVNVVEGFSC